MGRISLLNLQLVEKYFKKYPDLFTDKEKMMVLYHTRVDYTDTSNINYSLVPDCVREVHDELGIIKDENNLYLGFLQMLDEQFPVHDRKILEVGGGTLPRLGKRISLKQTSGKIVVYDPRLSVYEEDTDKLKLVRKIFDHDTSIGDSDLMIGLMPCLAAETIVDKAIENNVDFMVALCEGGLHGVPFDFFEDDDKWIHSLIMSATSKMENRGIGKLKIKYMKKYGNPYPVIYNERK